MKREIWNDSDYKDNMFSTSYIVRL